MTVLSLSHCTCIWHWGYIPKAVALAGELSSPGSNILGSTYEEEVPRRRVVWIETIRYDMLLRTALSQPKEMLATRMASPEVSELWKFPQEA